MAQITGLKERQAALAQIEAKLKSLKPLNVFLKTKNETNEYAVKFDKIKVDIYCENKTVLDELVQASKKKIADEIRELAEKYSITLDEEELKAMNESFVPGAEK